MTGQGRWTGNLKKRVIAALTLGLALAGPVRAADPCADYVPQPKPQNASRDIVGQDLDQITERGFLTVAVYDDYPPYSWEEQGKPQGVDVEIAREIANYLGVEARIRLVAAGENLEADLRHNIWKGPLVGGQVHNVMMRIPYDSAFTCRVEQVVFGGTYHSEQIAIAYRRDAYPDSAPVPAYFRFDTVAVENDSIVDFYLTGFAGGQTSAGVRRYRSMREAMDALNSGETMAAMGPLAQLEYFAGEEVEIHTPPLPGLAKAKWNLGTAVHFAYRGLSYGVEDAVGAALSNGRIAEIFAEFGLTHTAPQW